MAPYKVGGGFRNSFGMDGHGNRVKKYVTNP
jgi:hypothetical protein